MDVIATQNRRVLAFVGPVGCGKTSLNLAVAQAIRESGRPAIAVSSGHAYRAVAVMLLRAAGTKAAARNWSPPEILRLVQEHSLSLQGGNQVVVDGEKIGHSELYHTDCNALIPLWGFSPEIHGLVSELIRQQIEDFDGWVGIDGRSPNREFVCAESFYLKVWPWIGAARKNLTTRATLVRNWRDRRGAVGRLARGPGDIVIRTSLRTPQRVCDLAMQQVTACPLWDEAS